MSDTKISALNPITSANLADDDKFVVVDTDSSETKRVDFSELKSATTASLVESAPATLDTLNELAAALGDDPNFATTVTASIADKLPLAGGTLTGNIVMSGAETVDGRDLSADGAKLDSIEASATADQTNAEIRAAVEAASDSNVFTDADHTKLNGIENNADVTDATSVEAAGALMDPNGAITVDGSGNVGIGTNSPSESLDVVGSARVLRDTGATNTGDQNSIVAGATTTGVHNASYGAGLQFQVTNSSGSYSGSRIVSRLNADNNTANLVFQARNYGFSDSMTIDSSGNLLVGTTDRNQVVNNGTTGVVLGNDGFVGASRTNDTVMVLDREDGDGDIVSFRKDGTAVGSIASESGKIAIMAKANWGVKLYDQGGNDIVHPIDTSGNTYDGNVSLGYSNSRFKDLHLSGGVYLGGTGSANKLDDYEEGTFTGTLSGSVSGSFTPTFTKCFYTKVGRMVSLSMMIQWSANTTTGQVSITNLPFVAFNTDSLYRAAVSIGYAEGVDVTANYRQLVGTISGTSSQIDFFLLGDNTAPSTSSGWSSSGEIQVSAIYYTNS